MFFLLRNIPQIPNKNKIIETERYFTRSINQNQAFKKDKTEKLHFLLKQAIT